MPWFVYKFVLTSFLCVVWSMWFDLCSLMQPYTLIFSIYPPFFKSQKRPRYVFNLIHFRKTARNRVCVWSHQICDITAGGICYTLSESWVSVHALFWNLCIFIFLNNANYYENNWMYDMVIYSNIFHSNNCFIAIHFFDL